jgi:chromosomal replication initiation ATPase DnaA
MIAKLHGGLDHSCVSYAVRKMREEQKFNRLFGEGVKEINRLVDEAINPPTNLNKEVK